MIKIVIVEDDEKWIKLYEKIINDLLFESNKEYKIYSFKKYSSELQALIQDNSEPKI